MSEIISSESLDTSLNNYDDEADKLQGTAKPLIKVEDGLIETSDSSKSELNTTTTVKFETNDLSYEPTGTVVVASETDVSTLEIEETNSSTSGSSNSDNERKAKSSHVKIFKSFEERIDELRDFKAKNGHCRVPSKFESNPSMAAWCANLKQSYRLMEEGRKPILKLTKEKIEVLEDVGFEWKYSGRSSKRNSFDLDSSIEETSPEQTLKHSVLNNESKSASPTNVKEPAEKTEIEEIKDSSSLKVEDFAMKVERDTATDVDQPVGIKGEIDMKPPSTPRNIKVEDCTDEKSAVEASSSKKRMITRSSENSSILSSKKTRRERSKSKTFDERVEELKAFKAKNGHCDVSRNDNTYYALGSWCHNMRVSYRATKKQDGQDFPVLSQDKIDTLNIVGFDWSMKEPRQIKSFDQRLQDLSDFKDTYGHTRVPTGYAKNPSLAYWCNNVRNAYKMKNSGKKQYISLNQERIDALEQLGFEFGKRSRQSGELKKMSEEDGNKKDIDSNQDTSSFNGAAPSVKVECDTTEGLLGLEGGVGPIMFI